MMNLPRVIAHRGASAQAPENTLAAFRRAIELGAEMIELDVQFTIDGRIVVIHDERVQRTTNGRGAVRDLSFAEIRRLDAGSWFGRRFKGEQIPSLEEVCRLAASQGVGLLVELKTDNELPGDFDARLLDTLTRENCIRGAILQSFNHAAVARLRKASESVRLAALFDKRREDPALDTAALGANAVALRWRLLNPVVLTQARQRELEVFVWTVNRERDIRKMMALGVDGIITNHPDRALRLRPRLSGRPPSGPPLR